MILGFKGFINNEAQDVKGKLSQRGFQVVPSFDDLKTPPEAVTAKIILLSVG